MSDSDELAGMAAPTTGAAGWYRDPTPGAGAFARRYFDGERWTEQVAGTPPPPGARTLPPRPTAPTPLPGTPTVAPARARRRPAHRRGRWLVAGVIVVVAALVAGVLVVGGSGSSTPSAWDPRVAPIARAVERARGLEFDHPVRVRFVNDRAFRKLFEAPDDAPTGKRAARALGQLRAVGLLTGDVDLAAAVSTEQQSSVLAFYSPDEKQVYVRGEELGPDVRVTLAHELTHVLQDQHFDLDGLRERVEDDPNGAPDALRALVEGDADRIQAEYRSHLPAADRAAVARAEAADGTRVTGETAEVPFVLQLIFGAPYVYGDSLLGVLAADGGNSGVDRAFREPSFTQEVLIDPASALEHPTERHVADPKPAKGERSLGDVDVLGALDVYLLLAARIDPVVAFDAASGWAGGRMLTVKQGDRTCVRLAVTGRDRTATDALGTAFAAWAAAYPQGNPSVDRAGVVGVVTCDPGPSGGGAPEAALRTANNVLELRSSLEASFIGEGADVPTARCVASGLLRFPDVRSLLALSDDQITASAIETTIGAHVGEAVAACRA